MRRSIVGVAAMVVVLAACTSGAIGDSAPNASTVSPATTSPEYIIGEADFVDGVDVPWCADVEAPKPSLHGDVARGQIPSIPGRHALQRYGKERPEIFGGFWIDRDAGGVSVLAVTEDPAPHLEALHALRLEDGSSFADLGFDFDVVQVEWTASQLRRKQRRVQAATEDGLFSVSSREPLNRVVVQMIDPPEDRFAEIIDSFPRGVCVEFVLVADGESVEAQR